MSWNNMIALSGDLSDPQMAQILLELKDGSLMGGKHRGFRDYSINKCNKLW